MVIGEAVLATPVPANALPGGRGVIELGDVVTVRWEKTSFRCSATTGARLKW